ncbi:phosphopantetheine-binding protein [Streptomyces sp. NPDC048514]|uniref:phosphopantetheine-binding protein n=1 Tax=Streptomyces sp. NPDC048514 TaxID=3365564 RepID=UPI00371F9C95
MTAPWAEFEQFETLLRAHLPLAAPDSALSPDASLTDLGLDSLGTVGLLVDLEQEFGITVPDDALSGETFATAGALWGVVERLLPTAP